MGSIGFRFAALVSVASLAFVNACSAKGNARGDRPSLPAGETSTVCAGDPELRAACCDSTASDSPDSDHDGLTDACETLLGARFAPVVYHSSDESNFPTNVDAFLAGTSLFFYDDACAPDFAMRVQDAPSQSELIAYSLRGGCGASDTVTSKGTRSLHKGRTFYLEDVEDNHRAGEPDSRNWATYLHAYPSEEGTITLQYWRFYAFNDAMTNHGGDWEGIHLVLDRARHPSRVRLLGHTQVGDVDPGDLVWEGSHVRVFSEGGGHATRASGGEIGARGCDRDPCVVNPDAPATFIRQEIFPGGIVTWPSGARTEVGPLIDVGEKRTPMNGQLFVQYSGLWGSPGLLFATSGYWGPAFNETGMRADGFDTAWCAGMIGAALREECFAAATTE